MVAAVQDWASLPSGRVPGKLIVAASSDAVSEATGEALRKCGIEVEVFPELPEALVAACQQRPIAVVVEDALGGDQLVSTVRALTEGAKVPVFVGISSEATARVLSALDVGARGLVGMPLTEWALSRALSALLLSATGEVVAVADLELREYAAELRMGEAVIHLGRRDLALARTLVVSYPTAVGSDRIAEVLGDASRPASLEAVRQAVSRLRQQIGQLPPGGRHAIHSVRGFGYRWVVTET